MHTSESPTHDDNVGRMAELLLRGFKLKKEMIAGHGVAAKAFTKRMETSRLCPFPGVRSLLDQLERFQKQAIEKANPAHIDEIKHDR